MKQTFLTAAAAAVLGLTMSGVSLASSGGGDAYEATGPNATTSGSLGYTCTVFRPRTLSSNHPIIIWGNGTTASPSSYSQGLNHWASHGFVVVAANTSNAGTGQEMIDCLNRIISQNSSYGSTYYGRLNTGKVGISGHSQGGGGTIMAGQDPRTTVTAPMQPYTIGLGHNSSSQYRQVGRMLLLSGGSDTIAAPSLNQAPVYSRANVPVFWGTKNGMSHLDVMGDFGQYKGVSTAWFAYHLKGDSNARGYFYGSNCTLCSDRSWDVERKGTW